MNKIVGLALIFGAVVACYLFMAVMAPVYTAICDQAVLEMENTSNMSQYPGTEEGVKTFPYYMWAIPGVAGCLAAVFLLKRGR